MLAQLGLIVTLVLGISPTPRARIVPRAGALAASPAVHRDVAVLPDPIPSNDPPRNVVGPVPTAHPTRAPISPPPPLPRRGPLTWRPPTLVNPIMVTLCNCNISGGQIVVNLNTGQDYILKDPVVLTHPVVIQGGHNVVWIGGHIRPSSGPDIGIQLKRNIGQGGGVVHLEGSTSTASGAC